MSNRSKKNMGLSLEEKLDLILNYYREIKKNNNKYDSKKWQELARKVAGGNNDDFRSLTEHVYSMGFVDVSSMPKITPKGESFIGFVKAAEKEKEEEARTREVNGLTSEFLRLQNEKLRKEQSEKAGEPTKFDKIISWSKNNLIIAVIMILVIIAGATIPILKDTIWKEEPVKSIANVNEKIDLSALYTLDESDFRYLNDNDSSTWDFNTGTKMGVYYLTSFFNAYLGIKRNVEVERETYFCTKFSMKSIAEISGLDIYNPDEKQHRKVRANYYDATIKDGFAKYNPKLIKWVSNNLIPDPAERNIQGYVFQTIYNELYRNNVRILVKSYLSIPDEVAYKKAQEQYSTAMKQEDFDGAKYLFERYGEKDGCQFCYGYPMAIGFWLRRGIDGTYDEVWQVLTRVMRAYDREWYNQNMIADKTIWENR